MDENPQKIQQQSSIGSDTNSEESGRLEGSSDKRTICLVGGTATDAATVTAAQSFGVNVISIESGSVNSCGDAIYVLDSFEGPVFDTLYKARKVLLGPPALQQLSTRNEELPNNTRPLYNLAMTGVVVCFTGFRNKDDLSQLVMLVHHMGGSIRKDMSAKVTHLIANCTGGEKYEYAETFRLPAMHLDWVLNSWKKRNEIDFTAASEAFVTLHKLKPFHGARVCFVGFSEEDEKDMIEVLKANGGTITNMEDSACTHVVIDESAISERHETQPKAYVVKAEWFWTSVQKETCLPEKDYRFEGYHDQILSPNTRRDSHAPTSTTPSSASRRKRKRLHETLSSLAAGSHPLNNHHHHLLHPSPLFAHSHNKRRSSVSDAGLLSVSGSFLDCTASPDKDKGGVGEAVAGVSGVGDGSGVVAVTGGDVRKVLSARHQVFQELVQTESNYVNILYTIITMFKKHLEDMPESDALLNNTELKIIFGRVPAIYETHLRMLDDLRATLAAWTEDHRVGHIILRYATDLLHAYPPFVNAFEDMKETLTGCDAAKPRFHAFLKACQTRPECGRQGLQDLMIRPVQRLPSISLLLNDILKHTPKSHADHSLLVQALASIKEVMTHINEDKRKAEGQRVMFDIFNEIDNCPPDLVSSHRSFVAKCEVVQLSSSDGLSGKGSPLVLFLFSDQLEVCKKRSKAFNSIKSPNTANGGNSGHAHSLGYKTTGSSSSTSSSAGSSSASKPYKHVKLMSLSTIKRVIDIKETNECQRVFSFIFRNNDEVKEKLFSFAMTTDEEEDKTVFLRTLCRQMATNACTADSDKFLVTLEPHQLDIDTSYMHNGTLSKAFKFANRTRLKVGRAFSFNKTPSKLKRAVSSMMSPFGSSTNLTPASQLAQMRLASYSNISELGHATNADAPMAPMSVQPTRKHKTSSLGVNALKRL